MEGFMFVCEIEEVADPEDESVAFAERVQLAVSDQGVFVGVAEVEAVPLDSRDPLEETDTVKEITVGNDVLD